VIARIARALGLGSTSRARRAHVERVRTLENRLRAQLGDVRRIRARYDAAQTTTDNRKHWSAADGLSANAATSPEVRRTLRNRARYEVANNSYAAGIALTLANDCIGTGPRVQVVSPNKAHNDLVETLFSEWAEAIDLAGKLRTARIAKMQDGEAFGLLTNNPLLPTAVKLDVKLVEADQIASPHVLPISQVVDGITFDRWGNPETYHVLRTHPGEIRVAGLLDFDPIPAASVLHYFTAIRPGQARGVPEITPALPLFAQLRRYTLAVIAAAETAADLAMVIQSQGTASDEDSPSLDMLDTIELEKRMATVLPEGWQLGQAKAEQPTTTYDAFKGEILNEICRCLNMPFNVAAGNSSKYNYASGRLDHQTYFKAIGVERSVIRRALLDRIFAAWIQEASLIEGYLPQPFRTVRGVPHQWFWDGGEHVDPEKEARAQETRLNNNTTTLAEEYGRRGKDWEVEVRQRAEEKKLLKELGLESTAVAPRAPEPARTPATDGGDIEDDDEDDDGGEE
jgi:lambda family phage portal protein